MPSSSKRIWRGLSINGWKVYHPRQEEQRGKITEEQEEEDARPLSPEELEKELLLKKEEILKSAREEGEKLRRQILAEAEKEAESLRNQARREGYAEGYRKGEAEAAELKEKAQDLLEEARRGREELLARAEPEIIQLAVSLAEKLLDYQLEVTRETIIFLAARALKALPGGMEVVLKVNPKDEEICRENLARLEGLLKRGASLRVEADAGVPPGSCLVESEEAEVEFLLQRELKILAEKLLQLTRNPN